MTSKFKLLCQKIGCPSEYYKNHWYRAGWNVGQKQLTTFRGFRKLAKCSKSFYRSGNV